MALFIFANTLFNLPGFLVFPELATYVPQPNNNVSYSLIDQATFWLFARQGYDLFRLNLDILLFFVILGFKPKPPANVRRFSCAFFALLWLLVFSAAIDTKFQLYASIPVELQHLAPQWPGPKASDYLIAGLTTLLVWLSLETAGRIKGPILTTKSRFYWPLTALVCIYLGVALRLFPAAATDSVVHSPTLLSQQFLAQQLRLLPSIVHKF